MTTDERVQQERDKCVDHIMAVWSTDYSPLTIKVALKLAYTQGRIDEVAQRLERMTQERAA